MTDAIVRSTNAMKTKKFEIPKKSAALKNVIKIVKTIKGQNVF